MNLRRHLAWAGVAILGAASLATVALSRGETISALWVVSAALCVYLIAYRYYSLFIADKVLGLDARRQTPAWKYNDGLDYVPTNKHVLYGHHFAAIAGAGPLVGPVLAAQMGYLPGLLWILAGVVFAGAVQDFMVLFISTRRNGRSLGELVQARRWVTVPGTDRPVRRFPDHDHHPRGALADRGQGPGRESPWGMFTVMATIPIAVFMGVYMRYIRPGRIGRDLGDRRRVLLLAVDLARWPGGSASIRRCGGTAVHLHRRCRLTWMLIGYGFVAAVHAGVADPRPA